VRLGKDRAQFELTVFEVLFPIRPVPAQLSLAFDNRKDMLAFPDRYVGADRIACTHDLPFRVNLQTARGRIDIGLQKENDGFDEEVGAGGLIPFVQQLFDPLLTNIKRLEPFKYRLTHLSRLQIEGIGVVDRLFDLNELITVLPVNSHLPVSSGSK
jgi:hypothetical protein